MTDPQVGIPSRAPSATSVDDIVMPFEVAKLDLRGRVVRLGPAVDEILSRHAYPQPVAKLLGEALVLTVMLGSALKIDGRFILQTVGKTVSGVSILATTRQPHPVFSSSNGSLALRSPNDRMYMGWKN